MSSLSKKNYTVERGLRRSWLLIGVVLVLIVIAGLVISYRVSGRSSSQSIAIKNAAVKNNQPVQQEKSVEGRYLFSGTIVLARAIEKFANGDYTQPFSQLSSFEPQKYDGWMADLECPVTNNNVSYQAQINNLVFNCRPEWLPNYSKYFNLVNLSNNHTNNMGREGFLETQKRMDEAGVQAAGDYDSSETENDCEVMALPIKVVKKDGTKTKGQLPIAFCAFHYFFRLPKPGEIETVQKYAKLMPVFGFMHIGVEYLPTAGADQVNVAHAIIDSGSEFVIGNSPHWVQNSEVYKGKPIFYSTGNFMFDQLDYETKRGLSIDVAMEVNYDDNVGKWLALGVQCKARRDDCLNIAKQQRLTKPELKLVYEPIANATGNKVVTHKGDAALQAGVEERLNWAKTKAELGQN